jgi:hypothetical protein
MRARVSTMKRSSAGLGCDHDPLVAYAAAPLSAEPDELPADMAEAIAALHLLGDEDLWRAARQSLAPEK